MRTRRTLLALIVLLASPALAQSQRRDNPTVRETLRWMQTTLESGAGTYVVYHEVRSVRLEDFVGCRVHFSYSTHQGPYANGEPAPEPNKTYHVDYFFGLADIDPTNIIFSKGSGLHAGDDGVFESPSFLTVRTRNDEKTITSRYSQSEVDAKPNETALIFSLDSIDNDYVVRFAKAFKHAAILCGGKPSLFADSNGRESDGGASPVATVGGAQSAQPRKDVPEIARAANGAIVSVVMSDKEGKAIGQGSGFFVSKDGLVVTNYHVIKNGSSAVIKLPDGAFFTVDGVQASDKVHDIAVLKAHGTDFRVLPLGNSDQLHVGEDVVAIGSPLSLESTVSNGIISGIRRFEEEAITRKILQITAPISPGSSGGPLFNMKGEVVGITTSYLRGGENLNFAVPVNDAKPMLATHISRVQPFPDEPEDDVNAHSSAAGGGGYLVSRSEPFIHHYEGNPCGAIYSMGTKEWERCDLPEMRYTLSHNGVALTAHCQSWDKRNQCAKLQTGKTYHCSILSADRFFGQTLSCDGYGILGIDVSNMQH